MKIEFIKETGLDAKTFYYTRVNESLVGDSLKFNEEEAKVIYEKIVELEGKTYLREILQSTEI